MAKQTKKVKKKVAKKKPDQQQAKPDDMLDGERLVKYILACKKEAADATLDRRKAQQELWNLFQNRQNYSKKKKWQSKVFAPKIWMKVLKASGEVKRAVLQTSKLFKMQIDEAALDVDITAEKRKKTEAEIKEDEKRFKAMLDKSNFAQVYSSMITGAFLLGLGDPKALSDIDTNEVTFENVDILNLFISPDYQPFQGKRPKYIIEYKEMDVAALIKMAEDVNEKAGTEIFIMSEIEQIESDTRKSELEFKERMRRGLSQYTKSSKKVNLLEFWGDIISEDGKQVIENQLVFIANEKRIIRNQPNPFDHKLPPHVLTTPLVYPHRGVMGTSLVEPVAKLMYIYNNVLNLYTDSLNWTVNPVFEYNPGSMQNPKDILTIFPGKVIPKNTNEQAVREVITRGVGAEAITFLDTINREMQEGTSVTEFIQGMPSRKTKTLGEIEIKTAESRGLFDVIAKDLEQNSIKPLLEMAYDILVQVNDKFKPRKDRFIFKVGGLTLLLMQRETEQRVAQIVGMALKSEVLGQMTDIPDLWKKFLSIYNLSDVFKEPEEAKPEDTKGRVRGVQARAEADARQAVARMNPADILRLTG